MTKHIHADAIHAWADGKQIEFYDDERLKWRDIEYPSWLENTQYRVKPEQKSDIRARMWSRVGGDNFSLVFVFDGETKAFKTVEFHDD